MKEFNPELLAPFDGREGRPSYIAHKGRVFDVSASKFWRDGLHMKRHGAGRDLSADIGAAPHGPEVLERYPQAGVLTANQPEGRNLPRPLELLLERFPFLRRHPHPMLVHFPIVFAISPTLFYLLYIYTSINAFETTAFHCLGAGLLFSIPAILSGFATWWLNYQSKPMRAVRIKILLSAPLVAFFGGAFVMRFLKPAVTASPAGWGILYLLLLLALIPTASFIGWYGASLTFPLEKR